MIEIFQGRLGSGKTYSTTKRAAQHLAKGLHVYANYILKFEGMRQYCLEEFGVEILEEQIHHFESDDLLKIYEDIPLGTKEAPILIVIDEAGIFINSKSWQATLKESPFFHKWLKQTRKVYQDIIFIAQSAKDVDTGVRRLTQFFWGFRDMDKFLFFGKIPGLRGKIRWLQLDQDGKTVTKSGFSKKDVRIFACYDTDQIMASWDCPVDSHKKIELKKVEEKKVMMNPMVLGLMILGGIAGIGWLGWSIFGPKDVPQRAPVPVVQTASRRTSPQPVAQSEPVKSTVEKIRILGQTWENGVHSVLVKLGEGDARKIKVGDGFKGAEVIAVSEVCIILDRAGDIVKLEYDMSPIQVDVLPSPEKSIPSVTGSLGSAFTGLIK